MLYRYSMYESKKLMWEVDVEGDEKDNVEEIVKNAINRYQRVVNGITKS